MSVKNVDYIISAKHYGGSARQYIRKQQEKLRRRGISVNIIGFDNPTGKPVSAEIWQGQWIAHCECGGASFVDPDDRIFFCFSCGNRINGGTCRPVMFPEDRQTIERIILERPVNDIGGLTDLERAGLAKPIIVVQKSFFDGEKEQVIDLPLVRSWKPGESAADLLEQQSEPIQKWKEANGI